MGTQQTNILWIVAARSGSKGIPDKNIRELGGTPLLALRILTALPLGTVLLSTDSETYAAIGTKFGAEVPFLRPIALASDSASSIDVVLHGARHQWMKLNPKPEQ